MENRRNVMKKCFNLFWVGFALIVLSLPASALPVVLELFTSQGCSSCPPADRLLEKLSKDPDLITLSMHVNYWDYIGWKDPFASEATTQRQHDYARAMNSADVFTPQLVIDGEYSVVGSDESGIQVILDRVSHANVAFNMQIEGKTLTLSAIADKTNAIVEQIFYLPGVTTHVIHGENSGRNLSGINVVTAIIPLGIWNGPGKTFMLTAHMANMRSVILVRDRQTLHILNAKTL